MKRNLKRAALLLGIIGLAIPVGLFMYYRYRYVKHFRVVQEGILYRSGQPDRRDLKRLRNVYGIRSVVNLRRADEQDGSDGPSLPEERLEAERLGLRFFHLPMDGDAKVDPNIVSRWLEIAQTPENRPILLHCKAGADRTGLLVAVYRIGVQGWSPQDAIDEAVEEGIDPQSDRNLVDYLLKWKPAGKPTRLVPDRRGPPKGVETQVAPASTSAATAKTQR